MSMTASMIFIGQLIVGAYSGAGVHDTQTGRIVAGEPAIRIVQYCLPPEHDDSKCILPLVGLARPGNVYIQLATAEHCL